MTTSLERPYLSGNYAPVQTEIEARDLAVVGEIPRDLEGVFVRNGANPRFAQKGRHHWFDGDGMLHAVELRGRPGRLPEPLGAHEGVPRRGGGRAGAVDRASPRGPTSPTRAARSRTPPTPTSSTTRAASYALWWLGGEPYVAPRPLARDPRHRDLGRPVQDGVSAHPKVDPVTGEMMFFDHKPLPPYLHLRRRLDRRARSSHLTTIDLPGPRLQHDMAITERHSILLDMSMMWDPALLAQGKTKVGFFRDKPARFGVLPRHAPGGEVRWFEATPCYMYHTINAWEEGDAIVLVGCKIDEPARRRPAQPQRRAPGADHRLPPPRAPLHRWTLRPRHRAGEGGAARRHARRVPDAWTTACSAAASRYSYTRASRPRPTLLFDGVVKYDTDAGRSWVHRYPAGRFGGEMVFAPRTRLEGRGRRVPAHVRGRRGDRRVRAPRPRRARTSSAEPVARVTIPQRVPTGYHAWWVPAADLARQRPLA